MRVVIIGANGFLGSTIYRKMKCVYEVLGTSKSRINGNQFINVKIENKNSINKLCQRFIPHIIINCAAITDINKCESNNELARLVHVEGVKNLISYCSQYNAKLIHFSSDYVFDGLESPYSELSEPKPINYYGISKMKADNLIIKQLSNYLILRPSILYGFNGWENNSFVLEIINELSEHNKVIVDNLRIKYPVLIDDLSDIVNILIKKNKTGLYNVASEKGYTRYQWAKLITKVFELDGVIKSTEEDSYNSNRPLNVKLETNRLIKEGVVIKDLIEGLKITKRNMERVKK